MKTLLRATFVPASQAAEGLLRATITDGDEVSGDQLLRAMNDEQAE